MGAIVLGAALLMFGVPHIVHKPKPVDWPKPPVVYRHYTAHPDTTVLRIRAGQVLIIKGVR